MDQQLSETLAAEIASKHSEALAIAESARENIDKALHAAADVGTLIDKARDRYHGRLHEWLREHVPGLTPEQADVYHGIHKVRQRRECLEADTRQLKLIGIIGDDELASTGGHSTGQRADGSRAIKWLSHAEQHYRELDAVRPIETWEIFERKALADTLAPMVALYKRAGGVA
jgi:RNA processing factor Prp31